MPTSLPCPQLERWQALFADVLSPEERDQYEQHLERCHCCQERLDHLEGGDAVLTLVRQIQDPAVTRADRTLTQVLERLQEPQQSEEAAADPTDLYFLDPADQPDLLGLLGPYEVQEVIGVGGMGVVLKAYEPALQRLVAIKVLAAAVAGSSLARRRFTREAQAAAAVCHEHIVTVHGVQEKAGLPYLVMQYIAGESLQAKLDRSGPLPVEDIVRLGAQTALALAAAHAQGLIHRDIKPANLLLENPTFTLPRSDPSPTPPRRVVGLSSCSPLRGGVGEGARDCEQGMNPENSRVKITDFGLARTADDVQLTQTGMVAGTPEYMAPEQARGEPVDQRADLFSLGSVLYAMCTGQAPFRGPSTVAVLRQVSDEPPTPIRALNPHVPAWLATVVDRLMAKNPADRFQSAAEVAALLEGYLNHLRQPATVVIPELPFSPKPPTTPPARGRGKWLLAVGIVVMLGFLGWFGTELFSARATAVLVDPAMPGGQGKPSQPQDGLVCLLVNRNSGRCLSVAEGSAVPGARIVQGPTPDQAGPSERWTLLSAGKAFRLRNERSGLVLEIGGGNPAPGVQAIQWNDQTTLTHQHWTFEPVGDSYVLHAGHTDLVLAIQEGSQDAGGQAIQWKRLPDAADQLWELRFVAQEHFWSLKGDSRNRPPLELCGPGAEQWVQFEPAGMRLTLPATWDGERPDTGMEIPLVAKGDFDITVTFALLQEPKQADAGDFGTRFTMGIFKKDTEKVSVATISHSTSTKLGSVFVSWWQVWTTEANRPAPRAYASPTKTKTGRLRLVRTGSELAFLSSAGVGNDFSLLKRNASFGNEDLRLLRLSASTGGKKAALDVRVTDLRVRAEACFLPSQRKAANKPMDSVAIQFHRGLNQPLLKLIGSEAETLVKTDAQGLQIDVPSERRHHDLVGVESGYRLRGDFEITLGYELLQVPDPIPPLGVGVQLYILLDQQRSANLGRMCKTGTAFFSGNFISRGANGKEQYRQVLNLPAREMKGRLRLRRMGSTLVFQGADGAGPFTAGRHYDIGTDDIVAVRAVCCDGWQRSTIAARLLSLELQAEQIPNNPHPRGIDSTEGEEPTPPPRGWLLTAGLIVAGLGLAFVGLLGVRLWSRRGRSEKVASAQSEKPRRAKKAAPLTAFTVACSGCGKNYRARAELAGKKLKCSQCGQAVRVPESEARAGPDSSD